MFCHPYLKEKGIQMPVVFLDGYSSHINNNLNEYCKQHKIILIAFDSFQCYPSLSTSDQDQAKDSYTNTGLYIDCVQYQDYTTPVKKSEDNTTRSKYPRPFKNALFWKGNTDKMMATINISKPIKKTKMYPTLATTS